MTFLCKYCQNVWLHWFKLPNEKVIPVDENGNLHLEVCPNASNAKAVAVNKKEVKEIYDWDLIEQAEKYIGDINKQLSNYILELRKISLQDRLREVY